jgi:hypothetical protein
MMCIDEVDKEGKSTNLQLFGSNENDEHRTIEIIYKACVPKSQEHATTSSCIMEGAANSTALSERLKSIKDWLAHPELILVYNEDSPNLEVFDEAGKISKVSRIVHYQWSTTEPTFILSSLHDNLLTDNVNKIQMAGLTNDVSYLEFAIGG